MDMAIRPAPAAIFDTKTAAQAAPIRLGTQKPVVGTPAT